MDRSLKIGFVNSVIWATIGTFVALQLNAYLWWVGLLVGGICGYPTYDLRQVILAIPHAWQRATSWRPNKEFWLVAWYTACILNGFLLTILFVCFSIVFLIDTTIFDGYYEIPIFTVLFFGFAIPGLLGIMMTRDLLKDITLRQDVLIEMRDSATRLNFFGFWFWTAPWFCVALWRENIFPGLQKGIPKIPGAIGDSMLKLSRGVWHCLATCVHFIWHLYRLIHSHERWLCSVDIALGVAVGYLFGNVFVGGLAGGAFWLFNYALMARLWLKTLPVQVR